LQRKLVLKFVSKTKFVSKRYFDLQEKRIWILNLLT